MAGEYYMTPFQFTTWKRDAHGAALVEARIKDVMGTMGITEYDVRCPDGTAAYSIWGKPQHPRTPRFVMCPVPGCYAIHDRMEHTTSYCPSCQNTHGGWEPWVPEHDRTPGAKRDPYALLEEMVESALESDEACDEDGQLRVMYADAIRLLLQRGIRPDLAYEGVK